MLQPTSPAFLPFPRNNANVASPTPISLHLLKPVAAGSSTGPTASYPTLNPSTPRMQHARLHYVVHSQFSLLQQRRRVEEASGAMHGWGPRGGEAEATARLGRSSRGSAMRLFSRKYYALCTGDGLLAAATNHLAITPLDVLKVNMQVRVCFITRSLG
jgi:hypothetical protein